MPILPQAPSSHVPRESQSFVFLDGDHDILIGHRFSLLLSQITHSVPLTKVAFGLTIYHSVNYPAKSELGLYCT